MKNYAKKAGPTALRFAAKKNSNETAKFLCELGANVKVDYGFLTPLYSTSAEVGFSRVLLRYNLD